MIRKEGPKAFMALLRYYFDHL